ncbi:MAG TPA: MFS transporter [Polyangiaceae bacterium]|jgi:MFS family permease
MIRGPRAILALLTALNLLNYMDRQVLAAVLPKVQEDLALSNLEAGELATLFLLGFFLTTPAFGLLADRRARKGLMAVGVVVWSVATLATGMVSSRLGLQIARAVVGVGEASFVAVAPTVLDDVAPADKRSRYLAVFYSAIPVGGAFGFVLGGQVERVAGWRAAFWAAGLPGLVLALVLLGLAEPPRNLGPRRDVIGDLGDLLPCRPFWQASLGYCAFTFSFGALAYWAPSFVVRAYDTKVAAAATMLGGVTVVAGLGGNWLGGVLGDAAIARRRAAVEKRLGRAATEEEASASSAAALLRLCAWATGLGTPVAILAFRALSPRAFAGSIFVCETAFLLCTAPMTAITLRSVPARLRATAMAVSIFLIHALGDLWSPSLLGWLIDHHSLRTAFMLVPGGFGVAALVWSRPLPRDRAKGALVAAEG